MSDDLWYFLANEGFRQRGEGFQREWSFHLLAAKKRLGVPLAKSLPLSQQVQVGDQTYGYQPFSHDVLFNVSTSWKDVRSLNKILNSRIPSIDSLGFQLLKHLYPRCIAASAMPANPNANSNLEPGWTFHRKAVNEKLGPPLSGNYVISPKPDLLVALQVFANETLYSTTPPFPDALKLSDLTPDEPLYHPLWFETYKVAGSTFGNESFGFNPRFHDQVVQHKLGTPISEYYRTNHNGTPYYIQVFSKDILFASMGGPISRFSELALPSEIQNFQPVDTGPVISPPDERIPGTMLSSIWLRDHPNTPDPIRRLIVLALKMLHCVTDKEAFKILSPRQRSQMVGDSDIVCADLVSLCLEETGVDTRWTVKEPRGTIYTGDRAANYYRPSSNNQLLYRVDPQAEWLPGDILIYKDFHRPPPGWLPDEYHHVVIYVGPFIGEDRLKRPYPLNQNYSVVSASIYSDKIDGATQANAAKASYYGYGTVVRMRHRQIEQMYG